MFNECVNYSSHIAQRAPHALHACINDRVNIFYAYARRAARSMLFYAPRAVFSLTLPESSRTASREQKNTPHSPAHAHAHTYAHTNELNVSRCCAVPHSGERIFHFHPHSRRNRGCVFLCAHVPNFKPVLLARRRRQPKPRVRIGCWRAAD